jgi:rhamnosyltransferase
VLENLAVSLVIRTKNESKWLWRCLKAVEGQSLRPQEIILVDNESSDMTIQVAEAYGVHRVTSIREYSPGKALNQGIAEARGSIVAILSAHCIPISDRWLEFLVAPLRDDESIAASYGRQLPLSFSTPEDKADLYAVFRPESRLQISDGFLNNANSAIRRSVWEKQPFDEDVTNIEDRVWGEWLVNNGWRIFYSAEGGVYHHNGMHRSSERRNQAPTVEVIESRLSESPGVSDPNYSELFEGSICPVIIEGLGGDEGFPDMAREVHERLTGDYWLNPVVVSDSEVPGFECLNREDLGSSKSSSVFELIRALGLHISQRKPTAQYLALFIPSMGLAEREIVSRLADAIVESGKDFAFLGRREFSHIWHEAETGEFFQVDPSMDSRADRRATFLAIYGQGSIFSIQNCVSGNLFAGKSAIIPIEG